MMTDTDVSDGRLLSLSQAAKLTGVGRAALERRIRRGEIGVRVLGKGKATKLRLTTAALSDAGLLAPADPPLPPARPGANGSVVAADLAPLVAMIREQGARIAALEDQRFRLAGELGATIERARLVEERMWTLGESTAKSAPTDAPRSPADDRRARRRRRATMVSRYAPTGDVGNGGGPESPVDAGPHAAVGLAIGQASVTEIALLRAVAVGRLAPRQATRALRLLGRAWRGRRRRPVPGSVAIGRDG